MVTDPKPLSAAICGRVPSKSSIIIGAFVGQALQEPPQSMPVSSLSCMPLAQVSTGGASVNFFALNLIILMKY